MPDQKVDKQHKNDIYGDITAQPSETPAIPAATVVLLRDAREGLEVLMLRKNSKIHFGGMWVFPGGRIDKDDYPEDQHLETAARAAAARETREEAGVSTFPEQFVWFAHWSPPPQAPKRFATWFFAARANVESVSIDGGEIHDHAWINPSDALQRHSKGEVDLAPPTWVTLYHLSRYNPVSAALDHLRGREATVYETHVAKRSDGVRVALWRGDSGYDGWDADSDGEKHRLTMEKGGFVFEHPQDHY